MILCINNEVDKSYSLFKTAISQSIISYSGTLVNELQISMCTDAGDSFIAYLRGFICSVCSVTVRTCCALASVQRCGRITKTDTIHILYRYHP